VRQGAAAKEGTALGLAKTEQCTKRGTRHLTLDNINLRGYMSLIFIIQKKKKKEKKRVKGRTQEERKSFLKFTRWMILFIFALVLRSISVDCSPLSVKLNDEDVLIIILLSNPFF